ncbi:mycothiol-dependent nitroreductase Rv2466c family protein [Gordonia paraffinivorans]|uniref:mycothiol-dependent nitroreductase Rv2466c family protein n=1 Tax=Gordonia paraffinivorans TaxID=175628 RepID=UPI001E62A448|nr:DsbA family protein [Gordonia paraffinivorans]MCD2145081.1 DsbA family protein [Gordonia paraffinivorans]
MTEIDYYFDPVCPFAWAASRWLTDQAARNDVRVDWHVMSLAVLNEGRELSSDKQRRQIERSRRLGRVFMAAVAEAGDGSIGPLYDAVGRRLHHDGAVMTHEVVAQALSDAGLPAELAAAMDDESFDGSLGEHHRRSQDALGETGGSPIIGIDGRYFFGPVLSAIPVGDEADALFSSLVTLARIPAFAQLRRPADGHPVFS